MSTTLASSVPVSVQRSPIANAFHALVRTNDDLVPAIARVALGLAILPHGAQKTVGWFGGYGFNATMQWFTDTMQIPWLFGFAAILAESLGGIALIVGFGSRLAALGVGAVFATAISTLHWQHGFFMNWEGTQSGEGIEYFLLGFAIVAVVALRGGGTGSIDRRLARHLNR